MTEIKNEKKTSEIYQAIIGLLEHHRSQMLLQREVSDRWFRFYLILIAAPLAAFIGLIQTKLIILSDQKHQYYLGLLSVFLFMLGLIFYYMNTVQRKNHVGFILKHIQPLEIELWKGLLGKDAPLFIPRPFGADFAVSLVIAMTNAFWLSVGIKLLGESHSVYPFVPLLAFVLCIFIQILLRWCYLRKIET